MKAKVFVRPKDGILDPEGKAIRHALQSLTFEGVQSVRAGRYFELELDGYADPGSAREDLEKMCRDLLSNPLVQDYSYEIEE
jgi:phosphoribosylformylglycinamidine synthase